MRHTDIALSLAPAESMRQVEPGARGLQQANVSACLELHAARASRGIECVTP